MVVEKRKTERIAIFRLDGSVDLLRMMGLRDAIIRVVAEGYLQVILDCRLVDAVNEKGLEVLTTTLCRLRRLGGDVSLLALPLHVEETFRAAGVYPFYEHYAEEWGARKACQQKRLAMAG
ncbi:MAG: STAS domain-containing protein [Candidatus Methylomirabilales bacterium]